MQGVVFLFISSLNTSYLLYEVFTLVFTLFTQDQKSIVVKIGSHLNRFHFRQILL